VGVTFPRVLGIEATGTVAACPGGEFRVGQQVATMMGGMGRILDGGYAEYTCVPARQGSALHQQPQLGHVGRGSGDAANAAGEAIVPVHQVYHLDEIQEAHAEMGAGSATGKIVVLTEPHSRRRHLGHPVGRSAQRSVSKACVVSSASAMPVR
jgi:NADPH:quinone reductase-like Zn-dependent oxidoreductase